LRSATSHWGNARVSRVLSGCPASWVPILILCLKFLTTAENTARCQVPQPSLSRRLVVAPHWCAGVHSTRCGFSVSQCAWSPAWDAETAKASARGMRWCISLTSLFAETRGYPHSASYTRSDPPRFCGTTRVGWRGLSGLDLCNFGTNCEAFSMPSLRSKRRPAWRELTPA
jgi:hypothetical protein